MSSELIISDYWIIEIPHYGRFVYYGTAKSAYDLYEQKCKWEQTLGVIRKADPENKKDVEEVVKEIQAVRDDRAAGITNLPFLPSKGWF